MMSQILQKRLLASKTYFTKPIISNVRFCHSSSPSSRGSAPDLSAKFSKIMRNIESYNESLQNLETLSNKVKECVNKFTDASVSVKALNGSIKEEIKSIMEAGETRRVQIKENLFKMKSETR